MQLSQGGWPNFEKLNSLSFRGDFHGIFNFFPDKLNKETFDGKHFCWGSCHIFFIFPDFAKFSCKNLNFPELSLRF